MQQKLQKSNFSYKTCSLKLVQKKNLMTLILPYPVFCKINNLFYTLPYMYIYSIYIYLNLYPDIHY